MPIVPQENALPNAAFSAKDVPLVGDTSGVEQAAGNLASTIGKIGDYEQKKANDAKLIDADAQLTNYKNDLIWNPQSGAYRLKGENALGIADTYGKQIQDKIDNLYGSMTNADQREAFSQRAAQTNQEFKLDLEKHTFTESKNLEDQKYKLGQDAYYQDAIQNYQTPGKVENNLALTEGLVRNWADKNGILDPESIKTLVVDAKSKIHAGVIERASDNGQDLYAKSYFDQHQEELGDKLPAVEKTLEIATTLGSAQRFTAQAVSGGASQTAALAKLSDIEEPKVKQKARELINQYYDDQEKAKTQAERDALDKISKIIDQTKDINAVPPSLMGPLSIKAKEEAMTYAERVAKGVEPPANGPTFQKYMAMASSPDSRDMFANTYLSPSDFANMTKSEGHQLIDLQQSIGTKDKGTADRLNYIDANHKTLIDTMIKAGILSDATSMNDIPAFTAFQANFNTAIEQKKAAIGRDLQPQEVQDIANQLSSKVVTQRGGFFSSINPLSGFRSSAIQVNPLSPNETVKASDIPANVKAGLTQTLQARGWPVTDENLVNFYLKAVNAGLVKPGGR